MATDYAKLTENLSRFYDLTDKVVRAQRFADSAAIVIPMSYELNLL